jgi:hypothetical protein
MLLRRNGSAVIQCTQLHILELTGTRLTYLVFSLLTTMFIQVTSELIRLHWPFRATDLR